MEILKWLSEIARIWKTKNHNMAQAIYETKDKQLIPLDDIQHINARPNEAVKDGFQMMTIFYKDGMKMTIPATEYQSLFESWEARRNGRVH